MVVPAPSVHRSCSVFIWQCPRHSDGHLARRASAWGATRPSPPRRIALSTRRVANAHPCVLGASGASHPPQPSGRTLRDRRVLDLASRAPLWLALAVGTSLVPSMRPSVMRKNAGTFFLVQGARGDSAPWNAFRRISGKNHPTAPRRSAALVGASLAALRSASITHGRSMAGENRSFHVKAGWVNRSRSLPRSSSSPLFVLPTLMRQKPLQTGAMPVAHTLCLQRPSQKSSPKCPRWTAQPCERGCGSCS